jgi:hypothetical protein
MASFSNGFTRRFATTATKFVAWGALTLIVVAGVVGAFWWWSVVGVFGTSQFDGAKWVIRPTREAAFNCYRGGMARDIQHNLLKPGAPKADVELLLGAPDYDASTSVEYGYVLGMCSGGLDYDVLHIYFDEHGSVQSSKIVQH